MFTGNRAPRTALIPQKLLPATTSQRMSPFMFYLYEECLSSPCTMPACSRNVAAVIWTVFLHLGFVEIAAYSADWNHYTAWYQASFTTFAFFAIFQLDVYYGFFYLCLSVQVMNSARFVSGMYTRGDVCVRNVHSWRCVCVRRCVCARLPFSSPRTRFIRR